MYIYVICKHDYTQKHNLIKFSDLHDYNITIRDTGILLSDHYILRVDSIDRQSLPPYSGLSIYHKIQLDIKNQSV